MSWQDKLKEVILEALQEGHRIDDVDVRWSLFQSNKPEILDISYTCTRVERDD